MRISFGRDVDDYGVARTKSVRSSSRRAMIVLSMLMVSTFLQAQYGEKKAAKLDEVELARTAFGADAPWYLKNIPFLEIDDSAIQRMYYYRWQVYRSHIREIGEQGTDETEFLADVPWARQPFTDLNDSSSFHILEGRWLRTSSFVNSLVDHLYAGGGNDRHFSESIASATFAWTEVTGDPKPALRHLDTMEHIYNLWDDHFDTHRGLYWVEPLADATEYTIASIDASGAGFTDRPSADQNENGFTGGYAFRPSINAYQFGNAEAIAALASEAGETDVASQYRLRAEHLREATLSQLWNPTLLHFTDVYQRSTRYAQAGTWIRGRELVGFVPWMFNLPPTSSANRRGPDYTVAWEHAFNAHELEGAHGLRTVEPTYPRYMHQYRYDQSTGLPECQWNGPAWPFQISQTLTGMANVLQDPLERAVSIDQYVHMLREYTRLQAMPDGRLDIQEDYNPDTGAVLVGLPRSHHYNHSTYNDLILSGLLGIRPRSDNVLELNPLLPKADSTEKPIRFFALQGLRYHGLDLTVVYDANGGRYKSGKGLSVFASGRRIYGPARLGHALIRLGAFPVSRPPHENRRVDLVVNVWERTPVEAEKDLPIASVSSTAAGSDAYQAIDGRLWFFPEIANGWSPEVSGSPAGDDSWLAVDVRHREQMSRVNLAFFSSPSGERPPTSIRLQTYVRGAWQDIPGQRMKERVPVANGITHLRFPPIGVQNVRVLLHAAAKSRIRLIEFEAFNDQADIR